MKESNMRAVVGLWGSSVGDQSRSGSSVWFLSTRQAVKCLSEAELGVLASLIVLQSRKWRTYIYIRQRFTGCLPDSFLVLDGSSSLKPFNAQHFRWAKLQIFTGKTVKFDDSSQSLNNWSLQGADVLLTHTLIIIKSAAFTFYQVMCQ